MTNAIAEKEEIDVRILFVTIGNGITGKLSASTHKKKNMSRLLLILILIKKKVLTSYNISVKIKHKSKARGLDYDKKLQNY
jgi:hypothetical protein